MIADCQLPIFDFTSGFHMHLRLNTNWQLAIGNRQ